MTLAEIKEAIADLSPEELRDLREYIVEREEQAIKLRPGTMDVDALMLAVDDIRAGLTDEEIEAMTDAMNEEYIEPFDEAEWRA